MGSVLNRLGSKARSALFGALVALLMLPEYALADHGYMSLGLRIAYLLSAVIGGISLLSLPFPAVRRNATLGLIFAASLYGTFTVGSIAVFTIQATGPA